MGSGLAAWAMVMSAGGGEMMPAGASLTPVGWVVVVAMFGHSARERRKEEWVSGRLAPLAVFSFFARALRRSLCPRAMATTSADAPAAPPPPDDEYLEFLSAATLTRRVASTGMGTVCGAAPSSSRSFYLKPNADGGALILAASRKLEADPGCVRARMIRARALASQGKGGRVCVLESKRAISE
jgi:hypothetical protein